jgi:hypothetical protein
MPIDELEEINPRDFDAGGVSIGHAAGAQYPSGAGRSLADRLKQVGDKVNEVITDGLNALPLTSSKLATVSTLTIAAGVVTVTKNNHKIDTEAAAASDDLDTISGGSTGSLVFVRAANDARTVVLKHGSGNLICPLGRDVVLAEDDDLALLFYDGGNWLVCPLKMTAFPENWAFSAASALTIASDAITVTQDKHSLETESAAASDNLATINGGSVGDVVYLYPVSDARTVVVKHGSGNIQCPAGEDITLAEDDDFVLVQKVASSLWVVMAHKCLSSAGAGLGVALGSTANGKGASLVGIEDSGGLITATTVEAALAEIVTRLSTNVIADPGTGIAIPVTKSGEVRFTIGAGAETNTLAAPAFAGQRITLCVNTIGAGTRAVTCAQALNPTGNTIMTFNANTDLIILYGVTIGGTLKWRILLNESVALS